MDRLAKWRTELPHVQPMYAIKANNNPNLVSWLHTAGVGFDCASEPEIRLAIAVGAKSRNLIFANPCKSETAIRESLICRDPSPTNVGVSLTTVDDPAEVQKLAEQGYRGDVLIRLLVDDKASKMPFGRKFGCPLTYLPVVLQSAKQHHISVSGVSFHVGSEAALSSQYHNSLLDARAAFDVIANHGFSPKIVDIGGGFPGTNNVKFAEHAAAIRAARSNFSSQTKWIAEPGRFFAASSTTLFTRIIGVRPAHNKPDTHRVYMTNEAVYGMFSNVIFDQQAPVFESVDFAGIVDGEKPGDVDGILVYPKISGTTFTTDLFGHSCDSFDHIAKEIQLPQLRRGDYLRIDNMGAYTFVSASEFNGFKRPEIVYV